MPNGFLVTTGDGNIDPGDSVNPNGSTPFTEALNLGSGRVQWANGRNTFTSSGDYFQGTDGNVYFIPDTQPFSFVLNGTASVIDFTPAPAPPCFVEGTEIDTPHGPVPVEDLSPGDVICTLHDGPQPILWHGRRSLDRPVLQAFPRMQPIELKLPGGNRSLRLSPQHAVYLRLRDRSCLVRARQLTRLPFRGARQMRGMRHVTYHHLLLPAHGIIRANGIWCESLFPGPRAVSGFHERDQATVKRLCGKDYGPMAAPFARTCDLRESSGEALVHAFDVTNTLTPAVRSFTIPSPGAPSAPARAEQQHA